MKAYLKYGVSAIALAATFSLAQAQERQGGERGAGVQQSQGEQGGAMSREGATQNQGTMEKRGNTGSEKGYSERGSAENREGTRAQSQRAAKNAPGEEQKEQSQQREGERDKGTEAQQERGKSEKRAQTERGQGTETRQRESQAGTAGRSETLGREGAGTSKRVSIHISGAQRTELHNVVKRDAGIRRYHRGEVRFSTSVGSRIPDEIEFFAPPPRFVEIDPEFRYYKIIVLEDEILVVDPATREIVDVIPT